MRDGQRQTARYKAGGMEDGRDVCIRRLAQSAKNLSSFSAPETSFNISPKPPHRLRIDILSAQLLLPSEPRIHMLITLVPLAILALFSAVVASSPINGQDAKEVDFSVFPEFASLGSLNDLVEAGTVESDTDADVDVDSNGDGDGIEARAANQCTLAKLKKILFDYSE